MNWLDAHTHHPSAKATQIWNAGLTLPETGYFSAGIHPWETNRDHDLSELTKLMEHPRCVALGEIGLDRLQGAAIPVQLQCFEQQLASNLKYKLPVLLHQVKVESELFSVLRKFPDFKFVFHGFRQFNQLDLFQHEHYYYSIGAGLLKNAHIAENLPKIPLNRLLIESDDESFEVLQSIYHRAAELLHLDLLSLQSAIEVNFLSVFQKCQIG